jgi:hypothetical protein
VPTPIPKITGVTPTTFNVNVVYTLNITGLNLPRQVIVYLAETGEPDYYQWVPPSQAVTSNSSQPNTYDGTLIRAQASVVPVRPPGYGQGALTVTVTNNPASGQPPFTASFTAKPTTYSP